MANDPTIPSERYLHCDDLELGPVHQRVSHMPVRQLVQCRPGHDEILLTGGLTMANRHIYAKSLVEQAGGRLGLVLR